MKNTNSKIKLNPIKLFSALLTFTLIILFSIELLAKKDTGFIEWRSISAANGYRVEIKSDNKIILETNVVENIYYVDLPKGKYEFRIGVLNFFKKPVVWSYWNPLRVIVSKEPTLDIEALDVAIGDKAILTGNNFLENTKLSLVGAGKTTVVDSSIVNEKRLFFPTEKLKPGTYDLILENPNNKKTTKPKYLVLYEPTKKPPTRKAEKIITKDDIEISSESVEKADISVDESVAGKTTVNIGPKSKEKLDITLENKSKDKVTVDINNRAEGKVNFNVENKSNALIALNVNNQSKESLSIGVVEKSKGKVDVNVNEKSRSKVDVNKVNADIDKFDVTIENKSKERFDINIGKEPAKIVQPKRKPEKIIPGDDITISSDSLYRADIGVEKNTTSGKTAINIGPNTKEDLEINLENKSKENVTVDINNRSEGKIIFNVENKSTEKLALNINNASKENFSLGINEKSKGKVDVKVDEKSKSKVDVNRINSDIENFDVTIENKTRDRFDINIGKKEIPPIVFKPSLEKFPKDYHKFTLKEYRGFVNSLARTCTSNLDVPDILIEKCHPKHVSLNLGDADRKILYNFIKLESGNYISRISSYKFYIEHCNPSLNFVSELLDFRLKNITQDENEKFYAKKTIESFNSCKNKDE